MAKSKPPPAMHKGRAERFSASARSRLVEWEVVASHGTILIQLKKPGSGPLLITMLPDDAYELREALGFAYDRATGL